MGILRAEDRGAYMKSPAEGRMLGKASQGACNGSSPRQSRAVGRRDDAQLGSRLRPETPVQQGSPVSGLFSKSFLLFWALRGRLNWRSGVTQRRV